MKITERYVLTDIDNFKHILIKLCLIYKHTNNDPDSDKEAKIKHENKVK